MVSVVLSRLVCLLYVILLPAVWADYCRGYWDSNGNYYEPWQCGIQYCCGNCNKKYCCTEKQNHLTQKDQELCPGRPSNAKESYSAVTLGSIIGSLFPFIICVGATICCCVAPCCCIHKCIKGCNRRRTHTSPVAMATITPANIPQLPQQPFLPIGYQPSYPGHSIPVYEGPSAPIEPPPSYMESEAQAHSPGVFAHGQPTYPFQLHPYTSPPYSDELDQPPYNPSYD